MSGFSTPRAGAQAPKQMSSRLLTMKFMQRAVASSPTSTTSTTAPSPSSGGPSSKRRKLDSPTSSSSNPGTPSDRAMYDRAAISAALRAESEAQSRARSRHAKEGDETEWVLDLAIPTLNHTHTDTNGISQPQIELDVSSEDEEEEDIWNNENTGRQVYGDFKRKKPVKKTEDQEQDDEELSSASDEDEFDSRGDADSRTPVTNGRQSFGSDRRHNNSRPQDPTRHTPGSSKASYGSPLSNMSASKSKRLLNSSHSGGGRTRFKRP